MSVYAPILLFTYKRANLTKKVITSLKQNYLASESELFIFSDAAKSEKDQSYVEEVRKYIHSIKDGFANIRIIKRDKNFGCANSIISGVSEIISKYGKVIVVEDDIITTPNFLDFMNQALDFYGDKEIFSICGYSFAINFPEADLSDIYFSPRGGSWGWATWLDRWQKIDWQVSDYEQFKKDRKARKKFNLGGADMARMLDKQMMGKIDSWAIRWCYSQFKMNLPTIYPRLSKVQNVGFGDYATHSKIHANFKVDIDNEAKRNFKFSKNIELNAVIIKQFRFNFSLTNRIKNRLLSLVNNFLSGIRVLKKN